MKKIRMKIVAVMMSAFCAAALIPAVPAMADGQKVVTLGADLSEDQQILMLEYFGVYGEPVETLFINNQEEREHLSAYVPLEQIGTRTVSCAMVNPTTSGGIQVKTANLTWVTGSMIAQTLSTSGVKNCEVLAAAPFPVSGTGALTGIMMAYETASGEELDEEKKDAATQELVTTATIAGDIGQDTAVQIVNEAKVEVVQNGATTEEIQGIIDDAAQDLQVSLTDEDRELLQSLLETVSDIDYDEDEVDAMIGVTNPEDEEAADEDAADEDADAEDDESAGIPEDEENPDSILNNDDPSVFGDDVITTDSSEPVGTFTAADLNLIPNTEQGELELLPEEDFEEDIENAVEEAFEEDAGKAAPGLNYLTVQSDMTDLTAGDGEVSLYDAENDELIETIKMEDEEHVVCEPITDEETLKDLEWDEGIEYRIILSDPLEPGRSYYVLFSEGAFTAKDGEMILAESEAGDWAFETADYGISVEETVEGIKVDEAATANLYMDPEAAYAVVEYTSSDGSDYADLGEYEESGPFEITFNQAGEITVKASFYAGAEEEPEESEDEETEESSGFIVFEGTETFAEPISEAEFTVTVRE